LSTTNFQLSNFKRTEQVHFLVNSVHCSPVQKELFSHHHVGNLLLRGLYIGHNSWEITRPPISWHEKKKRY